MTHSHPPTNGALEATKVRIEARRKATDSRMKPVDALATTLLNTSDSTKARIGKLSSIKRDIRKQRQRQLPPIPSSVSDLEIPEEWKSTGGLTPSPFLLHDSGSGQSRRLLIYGTETALRHLAGAEVWFMDGTFDMSSGLFQQLYVIRAENDGVILTCAYCLMTEKSKDIYISALQAILRKCIDLGLLPRPHLIMTDFEAAAMKAATAVFGSCVEIKGCYFHLCQSTWRRIQNLGLVGDYRKNEEIRLYCGMLDALAFLPTQDVNKGMQYLWETAPLQLAELLSYFDKTYVSGTTRPTPQPALFPPPVWNVHQATLQSSHRTNNFCEAWNNRFKTLISQQNPSIWTVLQAIQKDEALERTRQLTKDATRKKKKTEAHQKLLFQLCKEYVEGVRDLPTFLRAVGETIRF